MNEGLRLRVATDLLFAILETGAVIDPAVDRTASLADLLLLGGVHAQWRPGRRSQPRIHLPRAPMAESGRALLVARSVYLLLAGLGLAPAHAGPDNRAPESAKRRPKAR